jgi:aspartate carbamoyltransferase catalytic subunit
MNMDKLRLHNRNMLVLHPGPMNRGVEITSDIADSPQSAINEQVTNGIAIRMSVLYLLAGSKNRA